MEVILDGTIEFPFFDLIMPIGPFIAIHCNTALQYIVQYSQDLLVVHPLPLVTSWVQLNVAADWTILTDRV